MHPFSDMLDLLFKQAAFGSPFKVVSIGVLLVDGPGKRGLKPIWISGIHLFPAKPTDQKNTYMVVRALQKKKNKLLQPTPPHTAHFPAKQTAPALAFAWTWHERRHLGDILSDPLLDQDINDRWTSMGEKGAIPFLARYGPGASPNLHLTAQEAKRGNRTGSHTDCKIN